MTSPRIEIDLNKVKENASFLVRSLRERGISVTGVTKAVCGNPDVAQAMLDGGVVSLADARINNVARMRAAGITCPISMIRTPLVSEIRDVILFCDTSYNTEMDTIHGLSAAAKDRGVEHKIVLMVEMGDLREGILPEDLNEFAAKVVGIPGITLQGIAANFACMGNLAPTPFNMIELSRFADQAEATCGPYVGLVSGGSSANLAWALGADATRRINNLRLGEAILLGTDPVLGQPIKGLHTDAFVLFAEVIEAKLKPNVFPTGRCVSKHCNLELVSNGGQVNRAVLAIGQQDTDPSTLGLPLGFEFVGTTSDHTVVDTAKSTLPVGSEIKMGLNYSALIRAMSASDVTKNVLGKKSRNDMTKGQATQPFLKLV